MYLFFVKQFKEIDKIIIGIENTKQLNQVYKAFNKINRSKKMELKKVKTVVVLQARST